MSDASSVSLRDGFEEMLHGGEGVSMGLGPFAGAGAGDVQYRDVVARDKPRELPRGFFGAEPFRVEQLARFVVLDAIVHGQARAAFQRAEVEDRRAVAVEHVLQGALLVAAAGQLGEGVARGNGTVFGDAARGRPAAAGKSRIERSVERAAVDAGLSAGDDLREQTLHSIVLMPYCLMALVQRATSDRRYLAKASGVVGAGS